MADSESSSPGGRLLSRLDHSGFHLKGGPAAPGFTLQVFLCSITAALGSLVFGYTLGYTSPALLGLVPELQLSTWQSSFFSAIVNVGAMAGAVSGGRIADRMGRKKSLMVASVFYIAGWTMIAFSNEFLLLCTGRLLCGVATGVVSFTVPVYIAEIAPSDLRGRLGSLTQLAITMGILGVYTLGLGLQWRALAIVGIIPAVLLLIGLTFIPESPRWVAEHSTENELMIILHKLRGPDSDISSEMEEIQEAIRKAETQSRASLKDLLEPNLRKPLLVGVGLMILQQFSGVNSVIFFEGSIFTAANFKNPNLPGSIVGAIQ